MGFIHRARHPIRAQESGCRTLLRRAVRLRRYPGSDLHRRLFRDRKSDRWLGRGCPLSLRNLRLR